MDWKWIKEVAFGPLNLSHESFWKLQPFEFLELYEGWKWREDRRIEEIKELNEMEMRRMSILASWITAPHFRKPKKPTDFYNPNANKEKPKTTPEESKRMVMLLSKEMGVR
ncbi:hypothetical protein KYJ26_20170 [Bacillus sp. MCCB 382]|uniref:hypothetical protein n=1 Tax=Bacillus sp. MCCB 382 TaxID=2860197 RepID=UPI001C57120C|nr:hypothetical protein [Bacillus sp. MCCB 382]